MAVAYLQVAALPPELVKLPKILVASNCNSYIDGQTAPPLGVEHQDVGHSLWSPAIRPYHGGARYVPHNLNWWSGYLILILVFLRNNFRCLFIFSIYIFFTRTGEHPFLNHT